MSRSFLLQASIIVSFAVGSSAPTPLYSLYQARWGFSAATATAIFAVYALGMLTTFLVLGSLSDHVGRRPVLVATCILQIGAMALFASAHGVGALFAARIVQGLATGPAVAAAGAGMIDVDRERGTVVNGLAPLLGTGAGSLVAGLFVQLLPAPTRLIYIVLGMVFLAQTLGTLFMREPASPVPGALASLRPRLAVPPRLRRRVALAVPGLVGAWALVGLYGALGPALVHVLVRSDAPTMGGLALFVLATGGVAAVILARGLPARAMTLLGTGAIITGVAGLLHAVSSSSVVGFFVGTAVAGAGFGASFQGAIRSVVPLAATHERAGVLSVIYIVSYLAMGVPALAAGLVIAHGGGMRATAVGYGLVVICLAVTTLAGTLLGPPAS